MSYNVLQRIEKYYPGSNENWQLKQGEYKEFNTYINSFASYIWLKYTHLNTIDIKLLIKGDVTVTLKTNLGQVLYKKRYKSTDACEYFIKGVKLGDYIIFPCFYSHSNNSEIASLEYGTYIGSQNEVNLALAICTYKREQQLLRNVDEISNTINNENSTLSGKVKVFICDNANTLENINLTNIKLYKNLNLGGAGGFTRCLIEILNSNYKFTHVLMMDDDAYLCGFMLERTYAFLSYIKEEYKEYFGGGSFASSRELNILKISGENFENGKIRGNYNLDMNNTVKVELDDLGFNGWWYCVIPMSFVTKDNLPLPLFIHFDDIEYSIRNQGKVLLLPSVCIWHDEIAYRHGGVNEYYDFRNNLIFRTLHDKLTKWKLIKKLFKNITYNLFLYRYEHVDLVMLATKHYLLGIDILKEKDALEIQNELMALLPKYEQILFGENKVIPKKHFSNIKKAWCFLTFNGLLFTSKRTIYVRPHCKVYEGYGAKEVICVDDKGVGFKSTKSIKRIFKYYIEYVKVCFEINRKFKIASLSYINNIHKVTNEAFWRRYLNID